MGEIACTELFIRKPLIHCPHNHPHTSTSVSFHRNFFPQRPRLSRRGFRDTEPNTSQSHDIPVEIFVAYFLCVRHLGFSRRNPDYITRSIGLIVAGPRVTLRQPGYATNISTSLYVHYTRFFHATSSGAASLSHVLRCGVTVTVHLMVSRDPRAKRPRDSTNLTLVIFGIHSLQGRSSR
jgi:hypothetical protein